MKKIGIVGTGKSVGIANDHLVGIQSSNDWILEAIYDISMQNAQEFVQQNNLDSGIICSSLNDLLDKVDAVAICTDNFSHKKIALAAFAKDLPVICEKPLATNYVDARMLASEARKANIKAYMGMQYRYHSYSQLIKEIIQKNVLGEVIFYRHNLGGTRLANSNVGLEWRMQKETSGMGAIADFGVHQLDLLDFYLKDSAGPVKELYAQTGTYIKERPSLQTIEDIAVTNDDVGLLMGKLENNAMVSLNNSRILPPDGLCLEIIGLKAAIYMDKNENVFLRNKNQEDEWEEEAKLIPIKEHHIFSGGARGRQYKEFHDIITKDIPYELTFEYGAEKLGLIEKAVHNIKNNKTTIQYY